MSSGNLTLLHHEPGAVPCLSAVGAIDVCTVEPFAVAVCELIERASDCACVDLTAVTDFQPSGLAILSALAEIATEHGVTLLIHTSPCVRRVLASAGLTPDP